MKFYKLLLGTAFSLITVMVPAQIRQVIPHFTHQDTLRGSITPERAWWDLSYYHLDISVDPEDSTIQGSNTVRYKVLTRDQVMQIDLQPPLRLFKAVQDGRQLKIVQDGNAHFIYLVSEQVPGSFRELQLFYGGRPKIAKNPPWNGGITWKRDQNGKPFIASSCQGLGASIWWPCKDHMYDEPDSMLISITVPGDLIDVSNGRLRRVDRHKKTKTYHWFVSNPINNYGVNINIGDYVHFSEVFQGEKGPLDCDYWVLKDHLAQAKRQFKQVPKMLKAFEYWYGPYPFYEDSYKLVEAPYLGMEHQSSVTYGNGFKNGYLGHSGSQSDWGMQFDFIIIHESAHEWFANNITYRDIADMWIHESFANYAESLYVEYYFGKKAGAEYVRGTRKHISNTRPIIGYYDVNNEGSGDMYSKGGNMLHTLRQIVHDDDKWRAVLRGLNKEFYHKTVTTAQIENFMSDKLSMNLKPFFDQYLRDFRVPVLEYIIHGNEVSFHWSNCLPRFTMPVRVKISGEEKWLKPTTRWSRVFIDPSRPDFIPDPDFYIATMNLAVF